jgi:16S rRNA (uracil1498-N3)-methyltransferase
VERDDLSSLAGVFHDASPLEPRTVVRLDEDATHHLRVRRLDVGDTLYLANGAGSQAVGAITRLGKKDADVAIDDVLRSPQPPAVHMLVPVADRDRMMWCAEKCAELGATSWRPVMWNRSRSVTPRGEGDAFAAKITARMASAIVQSRAPWLPRVEREASLADVIARLPVGGARLVLDQGAEPIGPVRLTSGVTIAVGPEGGMEPAELEALRASGFRAVSLGANVLRFETAVIAALAIVRMKLDASETSDPVPETPNG